MRTPPSRIEIALSYYCRGTPTELELENNVDLRALLDDGILERRGPGRGFQISAKGRVWVEMICATPYPVTRYVDPRIPAAPEPFSAEPQIGGEPGEGYRTAILRAAAPANTLAEEPRAADASTLQPFAVNG